MVVATIVEGIQINDQYWFIALEIFVTLLIFADFILRLKLQGYSRFFSGGLWNYFDTGVVIGCLVLLILILLSKSGTYLLFEELSEEVLLIGWSVFQTLRMVFIAKRQKLAH